MSRITGSGWRTLGQINDEKRGEIGLMTLLLALYAAQAVTGSMVQTALPAVFRAEGMSLERLGLLSFLFLPWALKVLWAPLVDRFGTEPRWILGCQGVLVVLFGAAAALPPQAALTPLVAVLLLMAFAAATQDIATDALGVRMTTRRTRAIASGASTIGGYTGFLLGGALWLWVYAKAGWAPAMITMAAVMALLSLPTLRLRHTPRDPVPERSGRQAVWRPVLANRALMRGLGLMLIWQTSVRLGQGMISPMLVDAGLSFETIAMVRGAGGMGAGLAAAVIGTVITRRMGIPFALTLAGLLLAAVCLALAGWSWTDGAPGLLVILQLALSSATALSFVALYAAMMNWCSPGQTATDFALLQSLDALLAVVCGMGAGLLAGSFGYGAVYVLAAALMLIALPWARHRVTPPEQEEQEHMTKLETVA